MPGESCMGCAGVRQRAIGLQVVGTARAHRQSRAIEGGGETSRPFVHEDPYPGALDSRRGEHINTI
jgi:hypothetical protein